MTGADDPLTTTAEFPGDDAGYAWWRHTHPDGYVLAVRARHAPVLHRAGCAAVDRDRHPGRLRAAGSRQICAATKPALRGWLASERAAAPVPAGGDGPGAAAADGGTAAAALLARCPTCGP
jgi:hypothetical protein